jgi:NOL1/NOP2/fmu family ribosome biogenesis protein
MKVLDSCSAPGGKTTQLAAMVGNEGLVVANEYEAKRCRILQGNVERMGCSNTVVVNLDTAILAKTYPDTFDLVLCDAPCSGEGMFRKNSLAISEWSLDNVKMCAERQREILANVAQCVAPTGYLIYSTCTFSQEENERNVQWFLDEHENFELCEVEEALKAVTADGVPFDGCTVSVEKTRRFYPHVTPGEGQFIALLRRREEEIFTYKKKTDKEIKKKRDEKPKNMPDVTEAARFLRENLVEMPKGELISLGGSVYLKPDIALPAYGVFSAGVCIGECQKGRIIPHHQLFSAFGQYFKRRIVLKSCDDATKKYLCGEEIAVAQCIDLRGSENGWAAVIIDGCAVGGAKISGGVAKNHYPKGLRN